MHNNIRHGGLDILGYSGIFGDNRYIRYMTTPQRDAGARVSDVRRAAAKAVPQPGLRDR